MGILLAALRFLGVDRSDSFFVWLLKKEGLLLFHIQWVRKTFLIS